jgi:nucleotide-binding universal stress UspA family protein
MQKNQPIVAHRGTEPCTSALDVTGSFVVSVTKVVTRFRPDAAGGEDALIVISPEARALGQRAASLAASSQVPVLVPRKAPANRVILAATDLAAHVPVLRLAAALASQLDAQLVALHNVAPFAVLPVSAVAAQGLVWPELVPVFPDPALASRSESLRTACQQLPVTPLRIIREESNVSDAISSEARAKGADLIVVGVRRRSWWQRLLREGVAAQVVEQVECSVLVAPLSPEGASGSARGVQLWDPRWEVSC